jgi:hypothetical protein
MSQAGLWSDASLREVSAEPAAPRAAAASAVCVGASSAERVPHANAAAPGDARRAGRLAGRARRAAAVARARRAARPRAPQRLLGERRRQRRRRRRPPPRPPDGARADVADGQAHRVSAARAAGRVSAGARDQRRVQQRNHPHRARVFGRGRLVHNSGDFC